VEVNAYNRLNSIEPAVMPDEVILQAVLYYIICYVCAVSLFKDSLNVWCLCWPYFSSVV